MAYTHTPQNSPAPRIKHAHGIVGRVGNEDPPGFFVHRYRATEPRKGAQYSSTTGIEHTHPMRTPCNKDTTTLSIHRYGIRILTHLDGLHDGSTSRVEHEHGLFTRGSDEGTPKALIHRYSAQP